jgi:hypothetical protein
MIDQEWASAAGLKGGMFGFMFGIGPERVTGVTGVTRIDFGHGPQMQRIGWTKRRFAADVDGVGGAGSVPEAIVRFVLRPAIDGERTVTFPMVDQGGLMGGWSERFAIITVGGQPMRLRFDPHHPHTLATAGAGVRLAEAFGGTLSGAATWEEIAFGVERPIRRLTLARPLAIGPLSITSLGIRTSDSGNAGAITDGDAPPPDPDEIVVVAKGKRDWKRDRLALGADVLARCSSIVFDKAMKVVRLTCAG